MAPTSEKMNKIKVAVIFGGRSGEHEVSIVSARSIMNALDKAKYSILPVYINKMGQWLLGTEAEKSLPGKENLVYLPADPTDNNLTLLHNQKDGQKIDIAFPVLHGTYGEDGTIQGLLELAGVPYVGSGVLGSALGMDKSVMKRIFRDENLPIVDFSVLKREDLVEEIILDLESKFRYPVFVKPANLGSSVGITKVHNRDEFFPALKKAALYDQKIIVEEGVENAREIELAVLGNNHPKVSTAGEVIPGNEFYDYDAKYINDNSKIIIPADLKKDDLKKLQTLAIKAFQALDLSGMARVDFLMNSESGKMYLSEVNTLPGFTSISMYPKLWEGSGVSYPDLLDKLIQLGIENYQEKQKNLTDFDSKLLEK